MKTIFYLLFFVSFNIFAQDSFILKNDGSKIEIEASSVRVIANEKILVYKDLKRNSEKKISYNDFDYALYSGFKFQIIKLNNQSEDGYFILSECLDKLLISKVDLIGDAEEENQQLSFHLSVIDKTNKVLENFVFNEEKNQKNIELRNQILPTATKYFPNCDDLLNRFTDFNKKNDDTKNMSILGVFKSPVYYACN